MLFDVKLEETLKDQPTLGIRTRVNVSDLPMVIGMSYGKIMEYLGELNAEPANAPYVVYFNMDMENLDVEMGFPVNTIFPNKGEISSSFIPAGKKVTAMYKGPYQGMEVPYEAMGKWINENGYEPLNIAYEFYYNSPADVPESELLTKIVMLVK